MAFIGLLFGAYKASSTQSRVSNSVAKLLSNGTSVFAPTTIIISLDGFRADFLQRNLTPTLNSFIRDGVSPKYMLPSFPSLTFPNHFTLATGRYPESHGIVGNTFWDPTKMKEFFYTDPSRSMQPEWWNAEPIWETAEVHNVHAAIHMWPGSEAHIGSTEPSYVDHYNADEPLDHKVERVLGWLDLPGLEDESARLDQPRPQLLAMYVPNVDADGHKYGPNSTEIRDTIRRADDMLGELFRGIDERNLTDIVNVIVVSDHGMATTDVSRLVQLEDLIDTSLIEHIDGWPLYGLRPYNNSDGHLTELYDALTAKAQQRQYQQSFEVYLRDTNMPARYHFQHNPRIAPLWIVPNAGWAIVTKEEFDLTAAAVSNAVYSPRGLHGYDHENPLMRAIFVARGPAFPHPKGSRLPAFQNIEVYNILCDSLGIYPAPNNGSLRLPFEPVGLHSDEPSPDNLLDDPPATASAPAVLPAIAPLPIPSAMPPLEAGSLATPATPQDVVWTTDSHGSLITMPAGVAEESAAQFAEGTRPLDQDGETAGGEPSMDENLNNNKTWWGWFKGQIDDFKAWTSGALGSSGDEGDGKAEVEAGADRGG